MTVVTAFSDLTLIQRIARSYVTATTKGEKMHIGNYEPMKTRFWMVYGERQGAPTYKHDTKASATQEAARLAKANPGIAFYVLKATASALANEPEVAFARLEDHPVSPADGGDIPF